MQIQLTDVSGIATVQRRGQQTFLLLAIWQREIADAYLTGY